MLLGTGDSGHAVVTVGVIIVVGVVVVVVVEEGKNKELHT
jgi:hypothetical protein